MAQTRRAQILMEPEEYQQLEHLAKQQQVSVAELIRTAVRERYFTRSEKSSSLIDAICGMNIDVSDWDSLETEIAEAHGDGLS